MDVQEALTQFKKYPGDGPSFVFLEQTYSSQRKWEELAEVYESHLKALGNSKQASQLWVRLGDLYKNYLRNSARASQCFRQAIQFNSSQLPTIQKGWRMALASSSFEDGLFFLEQEANLHKDSLKKSSVYSQMGRICLDNLEDLARATGYFKQAMMLDKQNLEAFLGLEKILTAGGDTSNLLRLYQLKIDHSSLLEEQKKYLNRIIDLCQKEDPNKALETLLELYRRDPQDPSPLQRLERLAREQKRWDLLVEASQLRAESLGSSREGVKFWLAGALILETKLEKKEEALLLYQKVLEITPLQTEATNHLKRLYRELQRWSDLVGLLEEEAKAAPEAKQKGLLFGEMAYLLETKAGDQSGALEYYLKSLGQWKDEKRIVDRAEALARERYNMTALLEILETKLPLLSSREDQYSLLVERGKILLDSMDKPDQAAGEFKRANLIFPGRLSTFSLIKTAYQKTENFSDLASAYRLWIKQMEDGSPKALLLAELAKLQWKKLEKKESALECYGESLRLQSGQMDVLLSMIELARDLGRLLSLAEVFSTQLKYLKDENLQVSLCLEMGKAFLEKENFQEAQSYFQRAYEMAPADFEVLSLLGEVAKAQKQWHDYLSLLRNQLELVGPSGEIQWEGGKIAWEKLADPSLAREFLRPLLGNPLFSRESFALLEEIYRQEKDWENLRVLLEKENQNLPSRERHLQNLMELGRISLEHLDQSKRAQDFYHQVLHLSPGHRKALLGLEALYRSAGEEEKLAQVLTQRWTMAGEENPELLVEAAGIYRELGKKKRALELLWESASADPQEERLVEVKNLAVELEDPALAAQALERLYALGPQVDYIRELGEIYVHSLNEREKAIYYLDQLVALGKRDTALLNLVTSLHEEDGNWREVARLEEEKLLLVEKEEDEIALLKKLVSIYQDKISHPNRAFPHYKRLAELLPRDREILLALQELCERFQNYEDLVKIIQSLAELAEDPEEKFQFLWEKGRIYEEKLLLWTQSLEAYQAAYQLKPTETAFEKIAYLYSQLGQYHDLISLLAKKLSSSKEPALHMRIGRIYQKYLGEIEKAQDHYQRALQADHQNKEALSALLKLCEQRELWQELEVLLENHGSLLAPEERGKYFYVLGRAYLPDDPKGEVFLQKARQGEESFLPAWEGLEHLYFQRKDWKSLLNLYEEKLGFLHSPSLKIHLYLEMGKIYQENLEDFQKAEKAYREGLNLDSDHLPTLQAISLLYARQGEEKKEQEILLQKLDLLEDGEEKVALLRRLSALAINLREDEKAQEWLYLALEKDPANTTALLELEDLLSNEPPLVLYPIYKLQAELDLPLSRLNHLYSQLFSLDSTDPDRKKEAKGWAKKILKSNPHDQKALEFLFTAYREEDKVEKLIRVVQLWEKIPLVTDQTLFDCYWTVAKILEKKQQGPRAISFCVKAQELSAHHLELCSLLKKLYKDEEQFSELAELYREELQLFPNDPEKLVELHWNLSLLLRENLLEFDEAVAHLKALLQIKPHHQKAREVLSQLLKEEGRWSELSALYLSFVEYAPSQEEKSQHYFDLGVLLEEKLEKKEQAWNCFRRSLGLNPSHPTALNRLIHRYLEEENFACALEFLEIQIQGNPPNKIELRKQAGDLYLNQLGEADLAAFHYEKIREEGTDLETLQRLEEIYEQRENWESLLEILSELAEVLKGEDRGKCLLKMARVFEKLGLKEKGLEWAEEALKVLPLNEELGSFLLDLYREFGLYQKQAQLCRELVGLENSTRKFSCHWERGKILYEKLGQLSTAIEELEECLLLQPDHGDLIQLLKSLYGELGQLDSQVDMIHRQLELISEPLERFALWKELGDLFQHRLYQPLSAIEAYQEALRIQGADGEVLLSLSHLFREQKQDLPLLEVLEQRTLLTENDDEWLELKIEMAGLQGGGLDNPLKALAIYGEIRHRYPEKFFVEEKALLEKDEKWEDLVQLLELEIQSISAPLVRSELLVQQGGIFYGKTAKLEEALGSFRKALDDDPQCLPALEALGEIYEQRKEWDEFEEVVLRQAQLIKRDDRVHSSHLYTRLGEREVEKGKTQQAVTYLKEAVDLDKTFRLPVMILREIYEKNRSYEEALALLDREAIIVEDPEDKAALYVRKGKILLQVLNLTQEAVQAFEKALEFKPYHTFALRVLGDLSFDHQNLPEVLRYYTRYLDGVNKEKHKKESLLATYRMAYTYRLIEDIPRAILWYKKCLDLSYSYPAALVDLGEIYMANHQWAKAHPLWEEMLRQREEKGIPEEESLDLFIHMGEILTGLEKFAKSIYYYESVVALREGDWEILSRIASLYERLDKPEDAIIYYKHAAKQAEEPEKKAEFYEEISRIYGEQNKIKPCLIALEKAHKACLQKISPLEKLVRLLYNSKVWAEVIRFVPLLIKLEGNPEKKAEYYYFLGTAYFEGKAEFEEALRMLNFALELKPHFMSAIKARVLIFSFQSNWTAMAQSYEDLLTNFQGSSGERLAVYLKLAELYGNKLAQIDQAIFYYEEALELDPQNQGAHSALANLYIRTDREFQKALKENLYLLQAEPYQPQLYHNCLRIFREIQSKSRLKQSLQILALMNDLGDREKALYSQHQDNRRELEIPKDVWEEYLGEDKNILQEIFTLITPHMERAYPTQLEPLGIRKKEHLPRNSSLLPMRILAEFERVFGEIDLHVYLVRRKKSILILENSQPPSLVISNGALEFFTEGELTHILHSYFSHVLCQRYLIVKLSPQELDRLFLYLAGLVYTGITPTDISPEDMQGAIKEVRASLPRRVRREVEGLMEQYWSNRDQCSPPLYYHEVFLSAQKFGLVATQDMEDSVGALFKMNTATALPEPSERDTQGMIAILQTLPVVGQLFQFAMSEEFSVLMAQQ